MQIIGIIGNTPEEAATLYEKFVNKVAATAAVQNASNADKDKAHPPAVVIGLTGENLESKRELAIKLGAECILSSEADIPRFVENIERESTPSIFTSPALPIANHSAQTTIGIIGGNGPYASAIYARNLAENGVPFIMLSETQYGHKRDVLMRNKAILSACGVHTITIPCNGAHEGLSTADMDNMISIIDATMEAVPQTGQVAVMGSGASRALYKGRLNDDARFVELEQSFIKKNITTLIFDGKDGSQADSVKEQVIATAEDIRRRVGDDNTTIILAATEFCCPFSKDDLAKHHLISTLHLLAEKAVDTYHNVAATKIQAVYRSHAARVQLKAEQQSNGERGR